MKQYLEALKYVLEQGEQVDDRTGTGAISVFGYQMRFNLQEGFPAVTTKRLAWRAVVGELLWFLEGSTDERRLAEITYEADRATLEDKTTIWYDNSNKQGKGLGYTTNEDIRLLGPIYGSMWRNWYNISENVVEVKEKLYSPTIKNIVELDDYGDGHKYTGHRFISTSGRPIKVLGLYNVINYRKRYVVQALDTGQITTALGSNIAKKVCLPALIKNVAYNTFTGKKPSYYKSLYKKWIHIIDRCYNKQHLNYDRYGGRGVFVQDSWLDFNNFLKDIDKVPGFYNWLKNPNDYELDKDYYGSNCYSLTSCIFIPKKMNIALSNKQVNHSRKIRVYNKDSFKDYIYKKDIYNNIPDLSAARVSYLLKSGAIYKGYRLEYITAKPGYNFRKQIVFDQIEWLINEIKTNPDSRRLILSAWNPNQLCAMALPPCHTLAQFRVYNGRLNCQLYQRSADMFLGVPFNLASYSLLTHMLAKICNLEVGDFIWTGGDCHIYTNHIKQVKEQVSRKPKSLPVLQLPEFSNLEELLETKPSDYLLKNYNPMPSIKAEMAV